ncbi:MAG: coproporphyrinogen III oxidase, partial [Myxococcota bacterium]
MSDSPETLHSQSAVVQSARVLVDELQQRFVRVLTDTARGAFTNEPDFEARPWQRDDGRHGGGVRFQTGGTDAFDRASVNVSLVHYDDDPDRKLAAAVALSSIVHPRPPHAPSVHLHVSHTSLKSGDAYWRIMADLNPSLPDDDDAATFRDALRTAAPLQAEEAFAQGDRYFWIPALQRHRGVVHFYLEAWDSGDFEADRALASRVISTVIDTYGRVLGPRLTQAATHADRAAQLAYHTVYLFQVLTLDRGTTSGLL